MGRPGCFTSFPFLVLTCALACTHGAPLVPQTMELPSPSSPAIAWSTPGDAGEAAELARWRAAVGAPITDSAATSIRTCADGMTVVSWNTDVGDGDIVRFVNSVRTPEQPILLLLQEVFRRGTAVPAELPASARFAKRLGGPRNTPPARDIESVARSLGLRLYYVPSMRNGGAASDEDRGNAILSSIPLGELAAIELPYERQRRVAVAATIAGTTYNGQPWRLRLVNAHFNNLAGAKRVWIVAEPARARQARALIPWVSGTTPAILGGDFNTWFGTREAAYRDLAGYFDEPVHSDDRPTRGFLRLDHLMMRLQAGWSGVVRRGNERFASDHFPLVGTLSFR